LYFNGDDSQGLSYEKEVKANGVTEHKHYLSAGGIVFAMQVTRNLSLVAAANPATANTSLASLRYLHHDHLGSVAAVTDGTTGTVIERLAFDPWGKRRNVNGQADVTDALVGQTTDRGYTEHEHLDEMGLIHMNGRVYDPLVGRMMSADPTIPNPYGLQSFNRYAYVYNNPLKLVDPSGFEPWGSSGGGSTQTNSAGNGTANNTYKGETGIACSSCGSGTQGNAVRGPGVATQSKPPPASAKPPVKVVVAGVAVAAQMPVDYPVIQVVKDLLNKVGNLFRANPVAVAVAVGSITFHGGLNSNEQTMLDNTRALNVKADDAKGANSEGRTRGLPPEGITPPAGEVKEGPASRPSEQDKGGKSLWDSGGGEWRYSPEDKWHNPHWDYNPHDKHSSPWQNVPIDQLPPRK
jgi:RHS repeat-associated protein